MADARRVGRAIGRWLLRALGLVLAFAIAFPLLYHALARAPLALPVALSPAAASTYDVYVVDRGYHTAIVVPNAGWRLGPPGRESAPWVEYAWGDRRFYRDSDYRPQSVFATAALPTAAVAYVAGRDRAPGERDGARAVYRRAVNAASLGALVAELEGAIVRDAAGARVAPAAPVAGYGGRFYDATGRYLWTQGCNAWTVARLAAAGLARPGGLVVLAGQVAPRLVGFTRVEGAAAR